MPLDLQPTTDRRGRAASAALPAKQRVSASPEREVVANDRPISNRLVCDVCGRARARGERRRLVWDGDPATRLVLAELCRECATDVDPFLELHGGRGRGDIRLVQEIRASPPPRTLQPRVVVYTLRGTLYLLIALASFLLVTLVTSRGR